MDRDKDDKSVLEKTVGAVKDMAATVKDAVSAVTLPSVSGRITPTYDNLFASAHEAAEPEPIKSDEEVVIEPMATSGFMNETMSPSYVVVRRRRKSLKKKPPRAAKKQIAKKSTEKSAKTTRKSKKKTKSRAGRKSVGKTTTKVAKKKRARKSRQ